MSHSYWTATPEWLDETVVILGCGPSLTQVNTSILQRRRVIATNDSFLYYPFADILYFCDQTWWSQNKALVADNFLGRSIVTMSTLIHGVKTLRCSGELGLDPDPGAIRHGGNSGFQAIHLAYHLGASQILLVGFDMHVPNGRLHWRARTTMQTAEGFGRTLGIMRSKFASIAQPLEDAGVQVINCTPGSALDIWPFASLEEALRET